MTHRILGLPAIPTTTTELISDAVTTSVLAQTTRQSGRYRGRGLTGSVASTTLAANATRGVYRISLYANASASTLGTLTWTVTWTDSTGAQSVAVFTAAGLTAGGPPLTSDKVLAVDSGNVAFSTTLGGTATYDLDVVLERLY